jgi:hypothetical protein
MKALGLVCFAFAVVACVSLARAKDVSIQTLPPVVVKAIPESGSLGVDPALAEIRVIFSKDMINGDWSCVNLSKESFPALAGEPRHEKDMRTSVLPAKLEPGKTYAILLNSEKYKNFKDAKGNPAMPYLLVFETRK